MKYLRPMIVLESLKYRTGSTCVYNFPVKTPFIEHKANTKAYKLSNGNFILSFHSKLADAHFPA